MTAGDGRDAAVSVDERWLDTLYELGRPLAHEIRNALNGVAVNLEVVRGRAARDDAAPGIARFAAAAATQLETLTDLTDGLLALVRPVAEPADAAQLLARLGRLLDAVAQAEGGSVAVRIVPDGEPVRCGLDGDRVRLLLARLLLAALDRGQALDCKLEGADQPTLRLRRPADTLPEMPGELAALVEHAGARVDDRIGAWTIVLPAAT